MLAEYLDEVSPVAQPIRRTWESIEGGATGKESVVETVSEGGSGFPAFFIAYAQAAYDMSLADPELQAWITALEDYAVRHPFPDPLYTGPDDQGNDRPARTVTKPPLGGMTNGELELGELGMGYVDIDPNLGGATGTLSVQVLRPDDNIASRLVTYELINPADPQQGKSQCGSPVDLHFVNGESTTSLNVTGSCGFVTLIVARTGPHDLSPLESSVKWSVANGVGIISNGTVQIGVNPAGNLIVPGGVPSTGTHDRSVGLRLLGTGYDGVSPDCDCEGWGVSDGTEAGWVSRNLGGAGIVVQSFDQDHESARSEVVAANGVFRVVHEFEPVPGNPHVFRVRVSVTNLSGAPAQLLYRRTMDWDVEPTPYYEFVTIGSLGPPPAELVYSDNNGFTTPSPLAARQALGAVGLFEDFGPMDQGALFDFDFGILNASSVKVFDLYYGAAFNEAQALNSLQSVGAQAYSLGQSSNAGGPNFGQPTTFFFGFKP